MIALRADDDIDRRLAAQDFRPLGLCDAARDNQHHPPTFAPALFLQLTQLAKLGIDFLRGAFANVAGVENDEIGVLDPYRLAVSRFGGEIAHAFGVIDVHLASE